MTPDDLTRDFRTKITVCECGCWLFARVDRYGYASFKYRGKNIIGHRFAYERLIGDIPPDHDIDHLCDRHRNCVNPAHMEPTSKSENARRANHRRWHGSIAPAIDADVDPTPQPNTNTKEEPGDQAN